MFKDADKLFPKMSTALKVIVAPLATSVFAVMLNIYSLSPCEYRLIQLDAFVTLTVLISDVSRVTFNICAFSSTLADVTFLLSISIDLIFILPTCSGIGI